MTTFKPGDRVMFSGYNRNPRYREHCNIGVVQEITEYRVLVEWQAGERARPYKPENLVLVVDPTKENQL